MKTARTNPSRIAKFGNPVTNPIPIVKGNKSPLTSKTLQNALGTFAQDNQAAGQQLFSGQAGGLKFIENLQKLAIDPTITNALQNAAPADEVKTFVPQKTESMSLAEKVVQSQQQYSDAQTGAIGNPSATAEMSIETLQISNEQITPPPEPNSSEYKAGISFFRPEIIALTKFNPLYDSQANLTDDGLLFDALVESLRTFEVDSRNFLKTSSQDQQKILQNSEELKSQLEKINSSLTQIYDLVKFFSYLERSTSNLNDVVLNVQEFLSSKFSNESFTTYDSLKNYTSKITSIRGLNSSLYECLNYSDKPNDTKRNFFGSNSTRSWVTALAEMKALINSHSRLEMKKPISAQDPQKSSASAGRYPLILTGDRITNEDLSSIGSAVLSGDLTPGVGITESREGANRFKNLYDTHYKEFKDNDLAMSAALYVALKEIRQKLCLTSNGEDVSLQVRNEKLNSLILNNYKNELIFNSFNSFTGNSLYDVAVYGDLANRSNRIFTLEYSRVSDNSKNAKDYFFKDFGSEAFFSEIITTQGTSDIQRIEDYLQKLIEVEKSFFNFVSNSGVLPVDESKLSLDPGFSIDPISFFENVCSKFIDDQGQFIPLKKYTQKTGFIGAGDHDLDALMIFSLAFHPNIGAASANNDYQSYKTKNLDAEYYVDASTRSSSENKAYLKNELYSMVINKINDTPSPDNWPERVIYGILTNIALPVSNDHPEFKNTQTSDKEIGKYAQIDAAKKSASLGAEFALITFSNSKVFDTIVELMRPIVTSNLSSDLSLIFFEILGTTLARLCPVKKVIVWWDVGTDPDQMGAKTFFHNQQQTLPKQNNLEFKSKIVNNLLTETNSLLILSLTFLNILNISIQKFIEIKEKFTVLKQDIVQYITDYLGSDPKKFSLMFNKQQLSLIMSSFQDIYDSYSTFSIQNEGEIITDQLFNSYLNGTYYSQKVVSVLKTFFKSSEYTSNKGYNKQIITVGIPQGLLSELHSKFLEKAASLSKLSQNKSNDIFKIMIYKVDLLNDQLVYKPIEFLFETSRFPVRTYSKMSNDVYGGNEDNLGIIFPTRDYNVFSDLSKSSAFFESKIINGNISSVFSSDYSQFLNDSQQKQILKNHIKSFLLENYLYLISGMEFNEIPFMLLDTKEIEELYKDLYSNINLEFVKNSIPNANPFLRKILHPKKFDRVFNIIFDPDQFIVDENKTPQSLIEKLLKSPNPRIKQIKPNNAPSYYIDVDKNLVDPSLNSYFVNIETLQI